jgi:hypothetical protein
MAFYDGSLNITPIIYHNHLSRQPDTPKQKETTHHQQPHQLLEIKKVER